MAQNCLNDQNIGVRNSPTIAKLIPTNHIRPYRAYKNDGLACTAGLVFFEFPGKDSVSTTSKGAFLHYRKTPSNTCNIRQGR